MKHVLVAALAVLSISVTGCSDKQADPPKPAATAAAPELKAVAAPRPLPAAPKPPPAPAAKAPAGGW